MDEALLEEAFIEGCIICKECGNRIEADCDICSCGWKNPLITGGLI